MFNVEISIKKWKSSLRKNHALEDGYIEELESHLRDDIEEIKGRGKSEEEAFNEAVKIIGKIDNVGEEYYKSDTKHMSKRPPWESSGLLPMLYWNYFKIALRNLKRYKGYSLINILGMTVGLTCVLIIAMMIQYELSYDTFHKNYYRIYRMYIERQENDGIFQMAPTMFPISHYAQEEIPEIEQAVCITQQTKLVSSDDERFYQTLFYARQNIFDVFTFDLVNGDIKTALMQPFSVVISEETAAKFFGDDNPVGKILKFQNNEDYLVTGVFKNFPDNSHRKWDIIASANTLAQINYSRLNSWGNTGNDYTYLLLKENADPAVIQGKLKEVLKRHTDESIYSTFELPIQPLSEVHFSKLNYDYARTIPISYLYIFGIIAAFILTIGCINFINLSTARSAGRFKEVGVRKIIGANRRNLIKQFMSEAFFTVIISFVLALAASSLLLGEVNDLLHMNLTMDLLISIKFIITAVVILLVTGFAAGFYPSLLLSNAKPALILKNAAIRKHKKYSLRSALVVFQFAVSVFLIIGTITVYEQTNYLMTKDLGFEGDRILSIEIYDPNIMNNAEPLKNELLNIPSVISASYSNGTPASNTTSTTNFTIEGSGNEIDQKLQVLDVDYDFLDTYELKLTEGRFFDKSHGNDSTVCLINETAKAKLGWTDIDGKRIRKGDERIPAIGVVKDFHYSSLRAEIAPTIFRLNTGGNRYLSLQLDIANITQTMESIKNIFTKHSPAYPFDYFFLNEAFARYYRAEKTTGKFMSILSILTIIICSIGLFGLTAFSVENRTKEVGIRKTLGASVYSIIFMLSKEFVSLVIASNIIIWPIAYYLLNKWLSVYPFRITLDVTVFAVTMLLSIALTFLIVGYYTARAALANPIKSLRYE